MLQADDFARFFYEVHGVDPFPWQQRLLHEVAANGCWPSRLDLPTGTGKTAAIDIAVFHLALEATRGPLRRAPVRVAFVVDRRLVVDDAHARACKLRDALAAPANRPVTTQVAAALCTLAPDGPLPLLVRRLRGGLPREGDWAHTPAQPTVLCSTVDQVGSRLLFRGYGVSDSMKPVHAGLIGADCLILLDEAHLAEPFRQTLGWVQLYRSDRWRDSAYAAPWQAALLSATPHDDAMATAAGQPPFTLAADDHADPTLQRRLQAHKPARLRLELTEADRRKALADEVDRAIAAGAQAVGVVLNRVARARDLFADLTRDPAAAHADLLLLIGPARSVQRDELAARLNAIRTGAQRPLPRPLIVVATQCIEAGVDIDLDALLTEVAPLDALRQRFGRLNRNGRPIEAMAVVIAIKEEVGARADDPVYGTAIREAWVDLNAAAGQPGGTRRQAKTADPVVDFGIAHFRVALRPQAQTKPAQAPVLMPAHLDLLSQTSPLPGADPEVALYLHGASRQPDSVTVIWRADVLAGLNDQQMQRLLTLMPPRAGEAIALPVATVRRWLRTPHRRDDALADVPSASPEDDAREPSARRDKGLWAFRWRGPTAESSWIAHNRIRPGDTIVVPASHGGVDQHGWNPASNEAAADVADKAASHRRAQYFAVRVAPGLLPPDVTPERLSAVLDGARGSAWGDVRQALLPLLRSDQRADGLPALIALLSTAGGYGRRPAIEVDFDVYGTDADGAPRGVVFVAVRGLRSAPKPAGLGGVAQTTEDDIGGSVAGFALSLARHSADVEAKAEAFARAAGLPPDRVGDLKLAGWLHDQGKRDERFQRWMHHGDPLGADPDDETSVLAKSGRALPPAARDKAGLPAQWRHEALSVRLARRHDRLQTAADADLVLWLVGTHHGHGRPLFPHADPTEPSTDPGPQSLAFDWHGKDWPALFELLKVRYGVWELARMEAILRLADHRASEEAAAAVPETTSTPTTVESAT